MPRVAAIACGVGLFTATLDLCGELDPVAPDDSAGDPARPPRREPLVVPDVRKQAYVFAKGTLEQGGFAWRVEGGVPASPPTSSSRRARRPARASFPTAPRPSCSG